ncbi:SCO family protein [Futiania mangrovi]|uniref:SCO family protein n=1 Tax=Futiania mangrovi TaxID=2959716 RepID=A0A9J6PG18_9PROT|nr:SCO family protein [Futiania mangrovii]MCP1335559.1 SCO family protein [Futiania mangrovii]
MTRNAPLLAALATLLLAAPAIAHDDAANPTHTVTGPADGYAFALAAPGTYSLPRIRPAADALLLDEFGAAHHLARLFRDRITVMAFMYTRCGNICPVAAMRMTDLQALAGEMPEVAGKLQLVSVSFDPAHDTPARMGEYARHLRADDARPPRWLFLTAPDEETIEPVLDAYDQPVMAKANPADPSGPYSHLLRVMLIDDAGQVRNIYSADFLDPRLVLNDVLTLIGGTSPAARTRQGDPRQ